MTALDKLIEAVEAGGIIEMTDLRRAITDVNDRINFCKARVGSIDAALALHDALLPGWWFQTSAVDGWATCRVARSGEGVPTERPSSAETPARAWLLAILRAYRSLQAAE